MYKMFNVYSPTVNLNSFQWHNLSYKDYYTLSHYIA